MIPVFGPYGRGFLAISEAKAGVKRTKIHRRHKGDTNCPLRSPAEDIWSPQLRPSVYYRNIQRMLDLGRVEGFDWDEGNERKSEERHGVSQSEAEQVFFSAPLLMLQDSKHSQDEPRFHALGKTESGRLPHIIFTTRAEGKKIRVISARDMNRRERIIYEEKSQSDS